MPRRNSKRARAKTNNHSKVRLIDRRNKRLGELIKFSENSPALTIGKFTDGGNGAGVSTIYIYYKNRAIRGAM